MRALGDDVRKPRPYIIESEITDQKYKYLTRTRRRVLGDELRSRATVETPSYHRSEIR